MIFYNILIIFCPKYFLKISVFVKCFQIFCTLISEHTIWFKFRRHVVQIRIKNCTQRLQTSGVSTCNGITEEFQQQIYSKNDFSDQAFFVTITDADIVSLKSLLILFDKCLDHMLVKLMQNRTVRNIQNFEVLGKKMVNHF